MKRRLLFGGRLFTVTALLLGTVCAQTPFATSIQPALGPVQIPENRGAAALWQSLKKLRTRASLIMITAHPDDEDGGMLAFESRSAGVRVILLTLTRGEGGANVMSSDYWDALGLLRTEELLAADNYYGVDQYFTRVCDYGFSKTMAEALQKWTHDRVLADVVRVVRMTRPLVVTSVFVGGPSDGHGNHQVAGLMAKEVYEAAADPNKFPDQIRGGIRPWKPLKYYARVPFMPGAADKPAATVEIPSGDYDPLLGESYFQLARHGLAHQKSQDWGDSFPRAGKVSSRYHRFASRVPVANSEDNFFDGIDISPEGIATLAADGGEAEFLKTGLKKIDSCVNEAINDFSAVHPEKSAPPLASGMKSVNALIDQVKASGLSEAAKYDVLHELNIKLAQFNEALIEALGLSMRATVEPDQPANPLYAMYMGDPDTFRMAIPGQQFGVRVTLANQSSESLEIVKTYLNAPSAAWWTVTAKKSASGRLGPGTSAEAKFHVQASESIPNTRPYFTRSSIEQPYYELLEHQYLNLPTAPYPLNAWAEAIYGGIPVKIGQVVQTSKRVTGRGVVYEPLAVAPAISVVVSPTAGIVPLNAKSFDLNVKVQSNVKGPARGSVALELPAGWRSEPMSATFTTQQDGEETRVQFRVIPSKIEERQYHIVAVVKYAGKEYREGYQVAGYAGVRPYFLYKPASYRTMGVDVKIAPGLRVGYVMGSGDDVPESLKDLEISVNFLTPSDLASADLSKFDAILLGIRAYAVRNDLIANNQRLLDYVKDGGVMITQYNTPEFDHNFGPYPYKMGQEPEEVTDENSKVTILDPRNPVFTWPNHITEADFSGWIEERGSKFMTTWDPRYEALLETHDPGQAPQKGGFLYAKYGKGIYIYNAYAFYRELPEGVPGAYRLIANMLSLAKNPER